MRKILIVGCFLGLSACASPTHQPASSPPVSDNLYQQLGGMDGISRIVEAMLINLTEDPRMTYAAVDADLDQLKAKLVEQICVESGGPCEYSKQGEVQDSQAELGITEGDFNALVDNLTAAMALQGISPQVQSRLVTRLAPMPGVSYR